MLPAVRAGAGKMGQVQDLTGHLQVEPGQVWFAILLAEQVGCNINIVQVGWMTLDPGLAAPAFIVIGKAKAVTLD